MDEEFLDDAGRPFKTPCDDIAETLRRIEQNTSEIVELTQRVIELRQAIHDQYPEVVSSQASLRKLVGIGWMILLVLVLMLFK